MTGVQTCALPISLLATLEAGKVTYTDASGSTGEARISGGIADIDNNIVSVCVY